MGKEIERKFLVQESAEWRSAEARGYRQGYICIAREGTVRVRICGDQGYLTIKGETVGASRSEFEYRIPRGEAEEMLEQLCQRPLIEKTRRRVEFAGLIWEIDEFSGENHGLIIAEVELDDEQQTFEKPPWVGKEVTGDPRYYNANLVKEPFSAWSGSD